MKLKKIYIILFLTSLMTTACQSTDPEVYASPSTLFSAPWNSGIDKSEPAFHIQNIDANTVVFRQSLRTTFEAPFIYLLFGEDRALLIDTGVEGGGLRAEVDTQIEQWLLTNKRKKIELTVMHSHGHGDHIGGDSSFEGRINTEIVGHTPEAVSEFFGIADWPSGSVTYDLGGRLVDILSTPGHHPAHVMVFDKATQILFTGDTIYPGRIFFKCGKLDALSKTIDKVATFAKTNNVQWLLGGHIEMMATPGQAYPQDKKSRRGEHLLELPVSIIKSFQSGLKGATHGLIQPCRIAPEAPESSKRVAPAAPDRHRETARRRDRGRSSRRTPR